MSKEYETVIEETDLNELIRELEEEDAEEENEESPLQVSKSDGCTSVWCNFWKSWNKVSPRETMRYRFQKLAGIIDNECLASLTLPYGHRIEFKELPHWWDVIRFKLCGFKYETYE